MLHKFRYVPFLFKKRNGCVLARTAPNGMEAFASPPSRSPLREDGTRTDNGEMPTRLLNSDIKMKESRNQKLSRGECSGFLY